MMLLTQRLSTGNKLLLFTCFSLYTKAIIRLNHYDSMSRKNHISYCEKRSLFTINKSCVL
jgi:hypothetical protein